VLHGLRYNIKPQVAPRPSGVRNAVQYVRSLRLRRLQRHSLPCSPSCGKRFVRKTKAAQKKKQKEEETTHKVVVEVEGWVDDDEQEERRDDGWVDEEYDQQRTYSRDGKEYWSDESDYGKEYEDEPPRTVWVTGDWLEGEVERGRTRWRRWD
jgi:hypothetical protein